MDAYGAISKESVLVMNTLLDQDSAQTVENGAPQYDLNVNTLKENDTSKRVNSESGQLVPSR